MFNRLFVCHAPVSSRIRDIIETYILLIIFGRRSFLPFWTIIFQFYLYFGVRSWTNLCFAIRFCIPHAFRAEFPARTAVENIIIIACDDAFILFKESFQICHLLFSVIPACQAVFFVCLYALHPPGGANFVYRVFWARRISECDCCQCRSGVSRCCWELRQFLLFFSRIARTLLSECFV